MPREAQIATLADRTRVLAAARHADFINGDGDIEGLLEHATVCVFMEDDNGGVTDLAVLTDFPPGADSLPAIVRVVNSGLEEPCLTVRKLLISN